MISDNCLDSALLEFFDIDMDDKRAVAIAAEYPEQFKSAFSLAVTSLQEKQPTYYSKYKATVDAIATLA